MSKDQKPWEGEDLDELQVDTGPEPMPKYEIIKKFSFGKERILPGDDLPDGISDKGMASLLKKGVLKAL